MIDKWHLRFLRLAREVSSWSKDPSTQVGCVIVDQSKRVISLGFNGLPAGLHDTAGRLLDRELKLALTIHAEENALLFAGTTSSWLCCLRNPASLRLLRRQAHPKRNRRRDLPYQSRLRPPVGR